MTPEPLPGAPGFVSSWPGSRRYPVEPVSTRVLIIAALLCGLAILVAFSVQVLLAT